MEKYHLLFPTPQVDLGNDILPAHRTMAVSPIQGSPAMLRAFTDHPEAVGESYGEHLVSASGFAATMFTAAAACLLHGLFPFALQTSGSRRIKALHARMVTARHRRPEPHGVMGWAEGI